MNISKIVLLVIFVVFILTASVWSEVLVYDGVPLEGEGSYVEGQIAGQNPTSALIIGETGPWRNSNGSIAGSTVSLSYPGEIPVGTIPGSFRMVVGSGGIRSINRLLSTPLTGKPFYCSVLIRYNNIDKYAEGDRAVWGLTKTVSSLTSYPSDDGITVGFERSSTGVNAVLRVLSETYVLQADIEPGTYHFVVYFDYNSEGDDTVRASLNPGTSEPSGWDVTASAEVLSSSNTLSFINVSYETGVNSSLYIDEWRVADSYHELLGTSPSISNMPPTYITSNSGYLNGMLISTGLSSTVVSVYYGNTDGGTDIDAWDGVHEFSGSIDVLPKLLSWQDMGASDNVRRYYRYAAMNSYGFVWAPETESFIPLDTGFPEITNISLVEFGTTTATIAADLNNANPETEVYICWDTLDGGNSSTSNWSNVKYLGSYINPLSITNELSSLLANGVYFSRFYAVNSVGDGWTDVVSFTNSAPAVSIVDSYGDEGDIGLIPINVVLSLDTASAIDTTVYYSTSDRSAVAGVDYVAADTSMVIRAGTVTTNITIYAIGDEKDEFPGKDFWVDIDSADGLFISSSRAQAGILDDDMGSRIFYDDFSSGNDSGWTRVARSSNWSVSDGVYSFAANGSSYGETQTGDLQWSEYGVRAMIRADNDWHDYGLSVRGQGDANPSDRYRMIFISTSEKGPTNARRPRLIAGDRELASLSGSVAGTRTGPFVFRPVAMRVNNTEDGVRIRGYIGFEKVFDVVDAENTYLNGMVGLYTMPWAKFSADSIEVFSDLPAGTVIIVQ